MTQQTIQLIGFQRSRRTSPYVNGIQCTYFHGLSNVSQFPAKGIQIIINPIFPPFKRRGTERTVQTNTGTKRNPYIKTVSIFIINFFQKFPLPVRNGNRKCRFFIACIIRITHIICCLHITHTGFDQTHCNLCWTDSRKIAPWQCFSCFLCQASV